MIFFYLYNIFSRRRPFLFGIFTVRPLVRHTAQFYPYLNSLLSFVLPPPYGRIPSVRYFTSGPEDLQVGLVALTGGAHALSPSSSKNGIRDC
jgi:hypothetical protein